MKLVTTYFQPTSILDSFKCQLSEKSTCHQLVKTYLNRLEVDDITEEGLQHRCTVPIRGKILTAVRLPVKGSKLSRILVLTDHPDPELILLRYDDESNRLEQVKAQSMYEQGPRPMEFLNTVVVDPAGRYAVVCCYAGKVKVIEFVNEEEGEAFTEFDVVLPEISILSLVILKDTTLGILHIDYQQRLQLLSRKLDLRKQDLSSIPSELIPKTVLHSKYIVIPSGDVLPHIVPVPSTPCDQGGVMVLGGHKVTYFAYCSLEEQKVLAEKRKRLEKKSKDPENAAAVKKKELERDNKRRKANAWIHWPWSDVAAWGTTEVPTRFLVGDKFGRMGMISFDVFKERGIILLPLGTTSPPVSITYLSSQVFYLGSHFGSSRLIQLSPSPIDQNGFAFPPSYFPDLEFKSLKASDFDNQKAKGKGKQRSADAPQDENRLGTLIETEGSYLVTIESFKNIAPIIDAIIIDPEQNGHKAVITCSGGESSGSLHVLRNGADFKELASVGGFEGVANVWAISAVEEDEKHTHVVISTLEETHVFLVNSLEEFVYLDIEPSSGFSTELPTLAISARPMDLMRNDDDYVVIQATEESVNFLHYDASMQEFSRSSGEKSPWRPRGDGVKITAASIHDRQIAVGLSNKRFMVLIPHGEKVHEWSIVVQDQIAAISADLTSPSTADVAHCFAVSYWSSNTVQIIRFAQHPTKQGNTVLSITHTVHLDSFPRSLLLHNFGGAGGKFIPYLLVGTSTGEVMTYPFSKGNHFELEKGVCSVSFGHAPVSLRRCVVGDKTKRTAVFAAGSRASLLFWEGGRLKKSPVLLKGVASTTSIDVPGLQGSKILVAYPTGITIGHIEALEKMHVQTTETGYDNPRRIAHDLHSRTLAVGFRKLAACKVREDPKLPGFIKLLEDVSLRSIDTAIYEINKFEEVTALRSLPLSTRIGRETTEEKQYYCAGVTTMDYELNESKEGRVLIFEVRYGEGARPELFLVAECKVTGCVWSFASINGLLAVTVNSDLIIMQLAQDSDNKLFLEEEARRSHNYFATSLAIQGESIILGDRISSVSVLKLTEQNSPARRRNSAMDVDGEEGGLSPQRMLKVLARDYSPLWPVCVTGTAEGGVIGADADLNLFSFRVAEENGKKKLEKDGCFYTADMVTMVINGAVVMNSETSNTSSRGKNRSSSTKNQSTASSTLSPSHVSFANSGMISVVVDVKSEQLAIQLTALERNLARVRHGIGSGSQAKYRRPRLRTYTKDEQASWGFLDGDFLEEFLKITDENEIKSVLNGESEAEKVNLSLEAVKEVLGTLQGLH